MKKEEIIELLKAHKKDIEKFGVKRIGIFGSFVRNEDVENSDIDLIVEFKKGAGTFKNFGGLIEYLERLFNRSVDILTPIGVESIRNEEIKENIKREIIYV
ncbi:nucleotidyltransferase family protein [bacterium]|nr:nucleotidyltransferase family protein [bacterium]